MTTKIQCPHCKQRISASDDVLGTVVECPACKRTFEAVAMDVPTASEAPVPAVLPRLDPAALPQRKRGGGTALVVGTALAVVAGGLFWWNTWGPGLSAGGARSAAGEKKQEAIPPKAGAAAPAVSVPGTPGGADQKEFQGVWRGTVPRTVVSKPYDVTLTITFNERGEGFPKFETPDGEATAFAGAGLATLFESAGKNKVILLREWDVSLSPDKTTMTWSEVDGPARVKFARQ